MTKIEWTDTTWNPVTGCTKVSAGCKNCYAEKIAHRFTREGIHATRQEPWDTNDFTDVLLHPDRLDQPLHWKRPRRVFVNSMSDLFHEDVPDWFIDRVFAAMALAEQHVFQVLTKRPERMLAWSQYSGAYRTRACRISEAAADEFHLAEDEPGSLDDWPDWPLPNVWLGVSVEDQATADERIPLLLETPAAVRFVSYEPALGPVNFEEIAPETTLWTNALRGTGVRSDAGLDLQVRDDLPKLDWLIIGGESGPKARPCDVEWIRSAVHQCQAAGVPVFVKQLGAHVTWDGCSSPGEHWPVGTEHDDTGLGHWRVRLRSRKGSDPSEWPADLRVREFPR